MSQFLQEIAKLQGQKVRFYVGGGERGFIQGPVSKVEGDFIHIEKEGEIRGTIHSISINAERVHYYEIDRVVGSDG